MKILPAVRTLLPSVAVGVIVFVGSVQAHADAPAGRYTVSGSTANATVTDNKTKLVWQQDAPLTNYTWEEAKSHCATVGEVLGGTGWRLPTIKELATLLDQNRRNFSLYFDTLVFPNDDPSGFYWSATAFSGAPKDGVPPSAWTVAFHYGFISTNDRAMKNYVRCVR